MRGSLSVVAVPATAGLVLLCSALFGNQRATKIENASSAIVVTNTNDSGLGSLRQALANVSDGGTIQFDPSLNGQTITLTSVELVIDKSITITGPGPGL